MNKVYVEFWEDVLKKAENIIDNKYDTIRDGENILISLEDLKYMVDNLIDQYEYKQEEHQEEMRNLEISLQNEDEISLRDNMNWYKDQYIELYRENEKLKKELEDKER